MDFLEEFLKHRCTRLSLRFLGSGYPEPYAVKRDLTRGCRRPPFDSFQYGVI